MIYFAKDASWVQSSFEAPDITQYWDKALYPLAIIIHQNLDYYDSVSAGVYERYEYYLLTAGSYEWNANQRAFVKGGIKGYALVDGVWVEKFTYPTGQVLGFTYDYSATEAFQSPVWCSENIYRTTAETTYIHLYSCLTLSYETEYGTAPQPTGLFNAYGNYERYVLSKAELPELEAEGYRFLGWSTAEGGEVLAVGDALTENATLYAVWEVAAVFFTISYQTAHGTAPDAKKVSTPTNAYVLTAAELPEISAEGYSFKGWLLSGKKAAVGEVIFGDVTLTADWESNAQSRKRAFIRGIICSFVSEGVIEE